MNAKISGLQTLKNTGLSLVSHKDMNEIIQEKKSTEKKIRRLEKRSSWARNDRLKKKDAIAKLCAIDDNAAKVLKSSNRGIRGRPRLEVDQPQLMSTILDIVQGSVSAAEEVNILVF